MGATPRLFHLKVMKCLLILKVLQTLMYLYQYIILLASLIYFWRGSQDHKDSLHA